MSFGVEDVKFVMNLWVLCSQPVHKELWGVACMQHKTFPLARGSGEAWSLHWFVQPHLGADWAWSLTWEGQSKLCILNLSQFFDLSSVFGAVRESACTPVTSFVPLRLDWWLLTELTQPCLCQKQWDIWISFSFYVLIWMSAHLCAW